MGVRHHAEHLFISLHGIAMLKGLYFTAVVFFSFFFFWCLISEVTERISTKLGHIFTYDCYFKKFGPNFPEHLPPRAGGQKLVFWDWLWTLTEHVSATEHDINNRKDTCQWTGTPLHATQIWWSLFSEMAENGWRVLAHPPKFSLEKHCQPYRMNVI